MFHLLFKDQAAASVKPRHSKFEYLVVMCLTVKLQLSKKVSSAFLQFFYASGRVTVPSLATGAMPKMLQGFKTAGRAAVTAQGFGRVFQRA